MFIYIYMRSTTPPPHHRGEGGQYHTPTTPQGGEGDSTTPPPHHRGGRGTVLWLTHDHGRGVGTLDHIYIHTHCMTYRHNRVCTVYSSFYLLMIRHCCVYIYRHTFIYNIDGIVTCLWYHCISIAGYVYI